MAKGVPLNDKELEEHKAYFLRNIKSNRTPIYIGDYVSASEAAGKYAGVCGDVIDIRMDTQICTIETSDVQANANLKIKAGELIELPSTILRRLSQPLSNQLLEKILRDNLASAKTLSQ